MGIVCNKCGNSNISEYCAKCNPFEYIVKPPQTNFSSIIADTYCGDPTCILCKNNGSQAANERYDYFPVEGEDIEDYLDAYSSYPKSKDSEASAKVLYDSRGKTDKTKEAGAVRPAQPAFSAAPKFSSIRFFRTVERRLESCERKIKSFKRNYPKFFRLLKKIFCVLCTILAAAGLYYISGNIASFLFGTIVGSYFNRMINEVP
jgi:hypothetical protein